MVKPQHKVVPGTRQFLLVVRELLQSYTQKAKDLGVTIAMSSIYCKFLLGWLKTII